MLQVRNSMQKYLFTGTSDSGKTTLASHFTADPRISVVKEVARDILRANPELATDPFFNTLNYAEQIRREKEAEDSGSSLIICDRGVLDIVVYATVFNNPINPGWVGAMQNRYNRVFLLNKYDIPFIPSSPEEEELRNSVDDTLRMWIRHLKIPVIDVKGTVDDRKILMEEHVREGIIYSEGAARFMEKR